MRPAAPRVGASRPSLGTCRRKGVIMRKIMMVIVAALAVVAGNAESLAQSPADSSTIEDIRSKLLRLPYYGVFDFLAFSYDKGTVTLGGYVYHTTLKADAERAVKQVARVDQVVNKIEELPVSSNDDDLRWKTYYAIYTDPFLSRYAPGGGVLWGHRHRVPRTLFGSAVRFPGEEPVGIYPIAIIVKNGRITLMGVVDNESDKTMAGMKARGVSGAFAVENELTVEGGK
jgi:hyperosmotically inducible protein